MQTSFLEIVELADGEIVLQRSDDDSEPMVRIRFSPETETYMMNNTLEVARVMIQAGIQAVAQLSEQEEVETFSQLDDENRIIH